MRKFGFHSGKVTAKGVKSDGKYVYNREIFRPMDFSNLDGLMPAGYTGAKGLVISGTTIPGSLSQLGDGGRIASWAFESDADSHVAFTTVIPSDIPAGAHTSLLVHWATSGCTGQKRTGSGVVWDVAYRVVGVNILVSGTTTTSGVQASQISYGFSGALSNATNYGFDLYGTAVGAYSVCISGAVHTTELLIPAAQTAANAVIQGYLFRDVGEGIDDMRAPAHLLFMTLEYRD